MKTLLNALRSGLALGLCLGVALTLSSCGGGSSSTNTSTPPSSLQFSNFQSASVVIGQPDFTTVTAVNPPSAATLRLPYGNPAVNGSGLYLPDYLNNRILGYNTVPTSNGQAADFVLGQADFISSTSGTSATTLHGPETAIVHDGKLLVLDNGNNRILIWNTKPTTTQATANVVVGQAGMTSNDHTCNDTNLYAPESFAIVNGALVVADSSHNRVLIWNTIPTSDGTPADMVIGQTSFTSCSFNAGGISALSLNNPKDVASIGGKFLVADTTNHRVLIWNSLPSCTPSAPANNCAITSPADMVLGQPNFTSGTSNAGSTPSGFGFNSPYMLATDGTRLAVADYNNYRVLIWNSMPACTTAPCAITTAADTVLGQPNFSSAVLNNDGSGNSATATDKNMTRTTGLTFVTSNQLIVMDTFNNRALVFNAR